jgi:TP901 family phage tail tape measure protein
VSRIQVDMDISDVISETQRMVTLLDQQQQAIRKVISATITENQTTGASVERIRERISATHELVTVIKENAKGEQQVITAIRQSNEANKQAALAAREQARSLREQARSAREANQVLQQTEKVLRDIRDASDVRKLTGVDDVLKRITGTVANLALYRGFNLFTNLFGNSISASRDAERQLNLIRTLTQDVSTTTAQYGDIIKRVASQSGSSFTDLANAAYDAASSQTASGAATEKFLNIASQLGRTTNATVQEAGKTLSTVLNTFGSEAGTSEEIAAKLFKTVDIGGLSLSQLSENFGNVSFLSRNLNVSFEETLATLSAMTRQGLSTNEAVTLVNATLQKILKPTENLKTAFTSLGFSSGEAAVASRGLFGVLNDLTTLVGQGKLNAADIFSEERAVKFFASFTKNSQQFQRDLDAISNKSQGTFKGAVDIVSNGPAAQIQRTMETIKNSITGGFGDGVNRLVASFVDLTDKSDKLEQNVKKLVQTVGIGTGVIVGTYTALRVMSIVQQTVAARSLINQANLVRESAARAANTAVVSAETAAYQRLIATQTAFDTRNKAGTLGFVGANPLLAAGTLLASIAVTAIAFENAVPPAIDKATESTLEFVRNLEKVKLEERIAKGVNEIDKFKKAVVEASNVVGNTLAKGLQDNTKELGKIKDQISQGAEVLRAKFVGYMDLARNKVQELEREFGQLDARIRQAASSGSDFADRVAASKRKVIEGFGSPVQQQEELLREFSRVTAKADALFAQGSKESVDEARRLYDEALGLIDQLESKQFEFRKQNATNNGQSNLALDTSPFDRLKDNLLQKRIQSEDTLKGRLEEQKKTQEIQIAKEKERLAATEQTLKKLQEFSLLDKQGDVRPEFLDKFGKVNTDKVRGEFDKLLESLKQLDPNILKTLDLDKLIGKEAARVITNRELEQAQQKLKSSQEAVNQSFADGKKLLDDYTKSLQNLTTLATDTAGTASGRFSAANAQEFIKNALELSSGGGASGRFQSLLNRIIPEGVEANGLKNARKQFADLEKESKILQAEVAELFKKTTKVNGVEVIDPAAFEQGLNKIREFYGQRIPAAIKEAAQGVGRGEIDPSTFLFGDQSLSKLNQGIDEIFNKFSRAKQQFDSGNQLLNQSQSGIGEINRLSGELAKNFEAAGIAQQALFGGIAQQAAPAISVFDQLLLRIQQYNSELSKFKGGDQLQSERRDAAGGLLGGAAGQGFQFGGKIHFADGGPIGSDNRMIYAQDGEFMVNANASRRFYSQITSMNNVTRIPQTLNGDTTNFGGVNFTINESQSPQLTAHEVNNKLRRAKRMGRM